MDQQSVGSGAADHGHLQPTIYCEQTSSTKLKNTVPSQQRT